MSSYSVGDTAQRNWGSYIVTNVSYQDGLCILCEKNIKVRSGCMLSVQSHRKRKEHWTVLQGVLTVVLNGKLLTLATGQSIDIPMGAIHTMSNLKPETCIVHEIQKGECREDDIDRFWDPNNRDVKDSNDPVVLESIECCLGLLPQLATI